MGFFKNVLSDAVGDAVGKGIRDAVGKAVETAVQPAATKLANKAAENLNSAADSLDESAGAVAEARSEAKAAGLDGAFANLASAAENYATRVSAGLKVCPSCGEGATADRKFCPHCGAKLPDTTLAEGYVCPKCGKQNTVGTAFCAECGAQLPAAAAESAAQLGKWPQLLPQYPQWTLGGSVELEESGEINGAPAVSLHVGGAGAAQLTQYVAQLRADGFVPYGGEDADVYYKVTDGVCRAFDKTDAAQGGSLSMTFFVGDYDRRAAAKEKAEAAAGAAKDTAKAAADVAKGLFKKFF